MAITDHPKADYERLYRDTLLSSGLADLQADANGDVILVDAPYKASQVKRRIVQQDIEVCLLIASTPDHPFREEYVTETPDELQSGALIPAYMGTHAGVEIGPSGGVFTFSDRLAQSFEHLIRWQDRKLDDAKDSLLYFINNSRIYLRDTTKRAKVSVPTIPIADDMASPPTLSSPRGYHNAVLAATIATLRVPGTDTIHRDLWTQIWAVAQQMIADKALSIPAPERLARIST